MPELHPSLRKHYRRDRLNDDAVPYAVVFDDGYELIIHAMKARSQYLDEI